MRHSLLMAALLCALPLSAEEAGAAPLPAAPVPDAAAALRAALQTMAEQGADDYYPAVQAVLDAGGTEQDYLRLMAEAAAAGAPAAQVWRARQLSDYAMTGAVPSEAVQEARQLLATAAAAGYAPAMLELAAYTASGLGGRANEREAMRLLAEACKAGSVRARAAYLLMSGRLSKENLAAPEVVSELRNNNVYLEEILAALSESEQPETARSWWEKADAHGSAKAPYYLAQSADAALGEPQAEAMIRRSAERHWPEALAVLGAWESSGRGAAEPPDVPRGTRHLQEAVMLGYQEAAVSLAALFLREPQTYPAERVTALYAEAAARGFDRAMVAHAYCLAAGRGCPAEPERGTARLRELAEQGILYAHVALADLYFNGRGTEPDLRRAVDALGEAAALGLPQAYTLMAVLTQLGNASTPPDPERARLYLRMAAEQGDAAESEALFAELVAAGAWHFLPPAP
ncbi:MAG: tetratricopeptide repeat protein [Akkermansia sp.]